MKCGYSDCGTDIYGDHIFKYFADDGIHKPVHSYHLNLQERSDSMRNNLPKLDQGLKKFLIGKGIDYQEFVRRDDLGEPDTVIARALGVKDRRTIANWREMRQRENERIERDERKSQTD